MSSQAKCTATSFMVAYSRGETTFACWCLQLRPFDTDCVLLEHIVWTPCIYHISTCTPSIWRTNALLAYSFLNYPKKTTRTPVPRYIALVQECVHRQRELSTLLEPTCIYRPLSSRATMFASCSYLVSCKSCLHKHHQHQADKLPLELQCPSQPGKVAGSLCLLRHRHNLFGLLWRSQQSTVPVYCAAVFL